MDLETTYKPYPVPHSIGQLPAFNYSTTNLYSTSPSPSLPRQDMLQESVEPLRIDMDLIPGKHDFTYRMNDEGVFEVFANEEDAAERRLRFEVPSIKAYYMDLEYVRGLNPGVSL